MFGELVGLRKPVLDKNKILHWPVLLLYAEVMSSDFIEDFCETDMFLAHLDMISILLAFFVFINICPINLHLMFPALLYILHYMISLAFKHVLRKLSTIAMGYRKQLYPWSCWIILWGKLFLVIAMLTNHLICYSTLQCSIKDLIMTLLLLCCMQNNLMY